jgi:hypothetical protein
MQLPPPPQKKKLDTNAKFYKTARRACDVNFLTILQAVLQHARVKIYIILQFYNFIIFKLRSTKEQMPALVLQESVVPFPAFLGTGSSNSST